MKKITMFISDEFFEFLTSSSRTVVYGHEFSLENIDPTLGMKGELYCSGTFKAEDHDPLLSENDSFAITKLITKERIADRLAVHADEELRVLHHWMTAILRLAADASWTNIREAINKLILGETY